MLKPEEQRFSRARALLAGPGEVRPLSGGIYIKMERQTQPHDMEPVPFCMAPNGVQYP